MEQKTETVERSNVATKIAKIMKALPAIEKGQVAFGQTRYNAYSIEQLTNHIRPLMGSHNLTPLYRYGGGGVRVFENRIYLC